MDNGVSPRKERIHQHNEKENNSYLLIYSPWMPGKACRCCEILEWRSTRDFFFFFLNFFIVHRKRIHRAHIRHNLIQATHCYVNTYHNGYTIHVLPYFLVHTYIYTHTLCDIYIHTHMYRHSHVSTYTYTHIYIFKPEVFFLANENIIYKTRMQKYGSYLAWWYIFFIIFFKNMWLKVTGDPLCCVIEWHISKSTLVWAITRCPQAPGHYPPHWWPGTWCHITRP